MQLRKGNEMRCAQSVLYIIQWIIRHWKETKGGSLCLYVQIVMNVPLLSTYTDLDLSNRTLFYGISIKTWACRKIFNWLPFYFHLSKLRVNLYLWGCNKSIFHNRLNCFVSLFEFKERRKGGESSAFCFLISSQFHFPFQKIPIKSV